MSRNTRRSIQHNVEYFFYRLLEVGVSFLPEQGITWIARVLAFLLYSVFRIRRQVALENLRIAFPEKSEEERQKIARKSYYHFCRLALEFLQMSYMQPERLWKKIQLQNHSILREQQEKQQPFVLVSGHFGNWEYAGALLAHHWNNGMVVIQKRQANRKIDKRMARNRQQWRMQVVYMRGAVKNCLTHLRQGKLVALLGDQDAGEKGIFVPFFRRLASTPAGTSLIPLRAKLPLVFAYAYRTSDHRYRLKMEKIANPTSLSKDAITHITRLYSQQLEKVVRQFPEQYFWMHRRWKTPPPPTSIP